MSFFDPNDPICIRYEYSIARFKIDSIVFDEQIENPTIIRKLIIMLANKFPRKYELYLSHLFPLDQITYYLTKI